jgi:hypothetical protein
MAAAVLLIQALGGGSSASDLPPANALNLPWPSPPSRGGLHTSEHGSVSAAGERKQPENAARLTRRVLATDDYHHALALLETADGQGEVHVLDTPTERVSTC